MGYCLSYRATKNTDWTESPENDPLFEVMSHLLGENLTSSPVSSSDLLPSRRNEVWTDVPLDVEPPTFCIHHAHCCPPNMTEMLGTVGYFMYIFYICLFLLVCLSFSQTLAALDYN